MSKHDGTRRVVVRRILPPPTFSKSSQHRGCCNRVHWLQTECRKDGVAAPTATPPTHVHFSSRNHPQYSHCSNEITSCFVSIRNRSPKREEKCLSILWMWRHKVWNLRVSDLKWRASDTEARACEPKCGSLRALATYCTRIRHHKKSNFFSYYVILKCHGGLLLFESKTSETSTTHGKMWKSSDQKSVSATLESIHTCKTFNFDAVNVVFEKAVS